MALELTGKKIVLGVAGSIAAYKAADVASRLVGLGADVKVVLTQSGTRFITPETFRAITGHTCLVGLFDEFEEGQIAHIAVIEQADLLLIAPATANILGKLAIGIADDLLTTLALAARCPVLIAPAMNSKMWSNPLVTENVEKLKKHGCQFIEPDEGRLACGMVGRGKLAPVEKIVEVVRGALACGGKDYAGLNVLITAGPTVESIDPVRFISNRSSGRMGYAIAEAAAARGAAVTLVSGPVNLDIPQGDIDVIKVESASEMKEAVIGRFENADIIIGAAAVSDFSPEFTRHKLKKSADKSALTLTLNQTDDIMLEVGRQKSGRVLIGFALETEDLEENAKKKLDTKNLDMIVANLAGGDTHPFGEGLASVTVISADGQKVMWQNMSKLEIANNLLTHIINKHFASRAEKTEK